MPSFRSGTSDSRGSWEQQEDDVFDDEAGVRALASTTAGAAAATTRGSDLIASNTASIDERTKVELALRTSQATMPGAVMLEDVDINNNTSTSTTGGGGGGGGHREKQSAAQFEWSNRLILKNRWGFRIADTQGRVPNEEVPLDDLQHNMVAFKEEIDEFDDRDLAKRKQSTRIMCCTIMMGFFVLVCMVVGITAGQTNGSGGVGVGGQAAASDGTSGARAKQFEECLRDNEYRSSQLSQLQPRVLHNAAPSAAAAIETPGSYQRAALCWLSEVDTFLDLFMISSLSMQDADMFQVTQRFALASIYFHWVPEVAFESSSSSQQQHSIALSESNWLSANLRVCEWDFLSCDGADDRVTELFLENTDLEGFIPSDIAQLSDLVYLDLRKNSLKGTIPLEIFHNLTQLEVLNLFDNQLTGQIPSTNLDQLRQLDLSSNLLSGQIPASLFEIPTLNNLAIGLNSLTGSLPTSLSNATGLTNLYISWNDLEGIIPDLSHLTNVKVLRASYNSAIKGPFPDISKLKKLEILDMNSVSISGTIPSLLWFLPSLQRLNFGATQLTGTIPLAVGLLTSLDVLNFAESKISGKIPTEIGNLSRLSHVNLSLLPDLTGTFPTELGRLSDLNYLSLPVKSQITGTVPVEICRLVLDPGVSVLDKISGPCAPQCECCTCALLV